MSQATRSAPPKPAVPAALRSSPAPSRPTPNPSPAPVVGREIPRQLARFRLAVVALAVIFAALTTTQLVLSQASLLAAEKDTEQLVRVQDIKVNLLRADAVATNAFLVGGLEPPEQRAVYDESIAAATRGIAEAATAQPLDAEVLTELNQVLVDYTSGMAKARANNRQGLPVGAGFLQSSSAELRTRGVVLVDALVEANTARAEASLERQFPILVGLPGVAALIVLVLLNQWIARRFHRRINTGIAGAFAAVLLLTILAVALSAAQANENNHLRMNSYATAVTAADARSAANAAKSNESLRLISRGSGQAYETAWASNAEIVNRAYATPELGAVPRTDWDEYVRGHQEITALDDAGDWEDAVALATSRADGAPTRVFAQFDTTLQQTISAAAGNAGRALSSGSSLFVIAAVLTVLGGLAAAWLGWTGVTARLKEYE